MGYDLHITRRRDWSESGRDITFDEWCALVERDPELTAQPDGGGRLATWSGPSQLGSPWLEWTEGRISTKNPDPALVAKMVSIACALGANVQGDDGEHYGGAATNGARAIPRPPAPAVASPRPAAPWWSRLRATFRSARAQQGELPFGVGDRVRDTWGHTYTVVAIDPGAEQGLGAIRLRRDDGATLSHALVAHGLVRVD